MKEELYGLSEEEEEGEEDKEYAEEDDQIPSFQDGQLVWILLKRKTNLWWLARVTLLSFFNPHQD